MSENMTSNESTLLLILTLFVPLIIIVILHFYERQEQKDKEKKEENNKLTTFGLYVLLYAVLCFASAVFFLMLGPLFFENEERLQEVKEAKMEAIAKELHVPEKEIQIEEKEYNLEKNKETKDIYEVKTKDQTWEVVLNCESFKKYRVMKVSNVLKEEKLFER